MTTEGGIEAHGLTRRFGERVAVDSVSFAVEPGELFYLVPEAGSASHTEPGDHAVAALVEGLPAQGKGEKRGCFVQYHLNPDTLDQWRALVGGLLDADAG